MKLQIVQIGNSLGIRIPKSLLKQCGFKGSVTVSVVNDKLILSPTIEARHGWEAEFKQMAQEGEDMLLDSDIQSSFDEDEWEW